MIHDTLSNLGRYPGIPHLREICEYFKHHDISRLGEGSHTIRNHELVLKKNRYVLSEISNERFEAHKTFADLQIVLSGREVISTVFSGSARGITPYSEAEDIGFFLAERDISNILLTPDTFLYLAPGELHRPQCRTPDYEGAVEKCVIKIRWPEP